MRLSSLAYGGIINILKKINLQGKFGTDMVIGAGNLLSAIGRGAFVN